ncbi:MAG: ABC transporter ATP-binding protein/permease [Abditibacteriales bacterium]|nr:ABC transporter ATP-binding protein/permease [Abditibacteriales bacterium]MDW8366611.1 ABC transporter ATP-binding protein [Abditibacteriales bacterium]
MVEVTPLQSVNASEQLWGWREEWRVFWRFFRYCTPYKDKIILIVLLMFVAVPLDQFSVFLSRYLVDEVLLKPGLAVDHRIVMMLTVIGLQAGLWVASRLFYFTRQIMSYYTDMRVTIYLRKMFYDHLHRLDINFLRSRPVGEHMYRNVADIGGDLVSMVTTYVPEMVNHIYQILWAAVLLSIVDWHITMFILLYIVPWTFLSFYLYTRLQRTRWELKREEQRVTALLNDGIAGAKTVKGFGRVAMQTRKYTAQLIRRQRVLLKYYFLSILTNDYVLWVLTQVLNYGLWLYVAYQVLMGHLSIGEFSVTLALRDRFEIPLQQFVLKMQQVRLALVPAQRMLETLDVPPAITDPPDAAPMLPVQGKIEFRQVTFAYLPGQPVLKNVSFVIPPGTTAAFVGPSGSGKSSILYLLLRLQEPQAGHILVDDVDVRTVKIITLQKQLGVVLQDTFLFGGTVADNIRYGKLDATDEEVIRAAQLAELHDFIASLPEGYETDLGEGSKLSGGQKQRLGIARALVRDPRVLILDAPTANLDTRVEAAIFRTLRRLRQGRTMLIITQRLVNVTDADIIYFVDNGEIVEQGTHEALLAKRGAYWRMWQEQTRAAA